MDSPFSGSVLITGGGGFLGRGILRYIERNRISARVTVYSRDEHKHVALRARFPWVHTVLGDINETDRLRAVMSGHDTVIHAAALKHIPEAEKDVTEAITVNINGSRSVAWAALSAGVRNVVGISTDKVASPVNVYGATKMLMERTFQEAQRLSPHMRFACVRYGNVVSSTGSVIPIFLDQIAKHDEVTITSTQMTRFWISIDDAVRLVEKALSDTTRRGHTYVARCQAMTVMDVAQAVWSMAGREGPVKHRVIGTRAGEKIHETLVDANEAPYAFDADPYIIVPPALGLTGEPVRLVMPYESSHPDSWMLPLDMMKLIKDAETV